MEAFSIIFPIINIVVVIIALVYIERARDRNLNELIVDFERNSCTR